MPNPNYKHFNTTEVIFPKFQECMYGYGRIKMANKVFAFRLIYQEWSITCLANRRLWVSRVLGLPRLGLGVLQCSPWSLGMFTKVDRRRKPQSSKRPDYPEATTL